MCLNWKAIDGLAVVAAALFILAPGLALAALPLLLLAACPLSMMVMMSGMGKMMGGQGSQQAGAAGQYTCPMHPTVQSDGPLPGVRDGPHGNSGSVADLTYGYGRPRAEVRPRGASLS